MGAPVAHFPLKSDESQCDPPADSMQSQRPFFSLAYWVWQRTLLQHNQWTEQRRVCCIAYRVTACQLNYVSNSGMTDWFSEVVICTAGPGIGVLLGLGAAFNVKLLLCGTLPLTSVGFVNEVGQHMPWWCLAGFVRVSSIEGLDCCPSARIRCVLG